MLSLLALALAAHAEDVVVPEPTVADVGDMGVSFLAYGVFLDALREGGVETIDGDTLRTWNVGEVADCADADGCPARLWPATDARIVVVLRISREGGGLAMEARLHSAEDAEPFKVYREVVTSGRESAWAVSLARSVRDALELLGPRTVEDASLRARTPAPRPVDPSVDAPEVTPEEVGPIEPVEDPTPQRPRRDERVVAPEDGARGTAAEARLAKMHLPGYVVRGFEGSGLTLDAYLAKRRVRAGQFLLEVNGGAGFGDVHRAYAVQLRIEPAGTGFTTLGTSTWEGAGGGTGPSGALAIGYAPTWWLDTSVVVGAQVGFKRVVTGWECEEGLCSEPASTFAPEPVRAAQVLLEPRVRLWPVASGVVKPYAMLGFTTLLHDAIEAPDSSTIAYVDSPAGATYGPMGGIGLALDVNNFFSFTFEAPVTWLGAQGPVERIDPLVQTAPDGVDAYGYLVRATGGIAVRF